jgi:hypothetical protein
MTDDGLHFECGHCDRFFVKWRAYGVGWYVGAYDIDTVARYGIRDGVIHITPDYIKVWAKVDYERAETGEPVHVVRKHMGDIITREDMRHYFPIGPIRIEEASIKWL